MKRFLRTWQVVLSLLCVVALLLPAAPLLAAAGATLPAQAAAGATALRNANLRAGPGTSWAVVGGVTAGKPLQIVAKNAAGDWYKLADGSWIFGQLVANPPTVPVESATPGAAAATPPAQAGAAPAGAAAAAPAAAPGWTLVAASASDFPGGRDHNHWYYLYSVGRNNFNWQEMQRPEQQGCFKDGADLGLEICSDQITTTGRGDATVQWKASKGGTYRFEWDAATLKFYKHTTLLGILEAGTTLPYAATVKGVIDWELFFWVATESGPYQIRVYRLDDAAAAPAAAALPAASAAPAAAAAPAAPATVATFGAGMKRVGADIAAGTYRAPGSSAGCYWERLSGFSGTLGSIIANEFSAGPQIVTISATDKGFMSRSCGVWTLDLSPIRSDPAAPFGSGTYFVGKDIAPGLWQAAGGELCYWETLSGFSGEFRDLHANDLVEGSTIVEIRAEETGFRTSGCGTWSKIE